MARSVNRVTEARDSDMAHANTPDDLETVPLNCEPVSDTPGRMVNVPDPVVFAVRVQFDESV